MDGIKLLRRSSIAVIGPVIWSTWCRVLEKF